MSHFHTPKDSTSKVQTPLHISKFSQIEMSKISKSESDNAQIIRDESFKQRPNLTLVDSSASLIISLDILRDLQGINASPKILEIIEKRIEVLSTLQRK